MNCKCPRDVDIMSRIYMTNIAGVKFKTYQSIYCTRDYLANLQCSHNSFSLHQTDLLMREVSARFLVRYEITESISVFLLFTEFREFSVFRDLLPVGNRAFHEVIFGDYPQRFKVDIDFGDELADYNSPVSHKPFYDKLTIICDTIRNIFSNMYSAQYSAATIGSDDICVCICETKGLIAAPELANKVKIGFHVTIGGRRYARNVAVIREFIDVLAAELPPELVKYVDRATNKTIQNWRILGCNKLGQPRRIKQIYVKPAHSTLMTDAIVGYYDWLYVTTNIGVNIYDHSAMLPARVNEGDRPETHSKIPEKLIERVVAAADGLLTEAERASFTYSGVSGNFVNYRRLAPSYCDFCRRVHEKDNTLYFALLGGESLVKFCRHNNKKR